ncbi:MAG TPA: DASS family sodium-coupled anion symporter [Candidatus Limnocylindria bacterium]|nr:DASS family sodium-coupled anion symporter [Candidatus Limnocylindria bacterium]
MALPAEKPPPTVDIRPLRTLLLERLYRPAALGTAALLYWIISTRTPPPGLSEAGLHALAVFAVCIVLWATEALPLMVTSLLALVALPMSGAVETKRAYGMFGNEAVFFILGVFILAACIMKTRLSTRIALVILHRFGHSPRTLLASVFLLNAVMSFFMSEHAVAAMNFPIILEIVRVLRLPRRQSNYARALFLSMAWGTTIGGVATLLGGARAPLALGMAREVSGESFTFLEWALANLPVVAVLLAVGWIVINAFYPIDVKSIRAADDLIAERAFALGRMSLREKAVAFVMLGTLAGWIIGGEEFGLASVALVATVLVFALGLVRWRDVEGYVNWGILLLYGGAIVLGAVMNDSGAATWLSAHTIGGWATTPWLAAWLISGLSIVLTELLSNSAVVALLMPVTLGMCSQLAIEPRVMALLVAVPAGLSFTLPIGTPANAIAYSSGYLNVRDMLLPGLILCVSAWITFNLVAWLVWPALGITLG